METFYNLLDLMSKPNKTTDEVQKLLSIMLDEKNELYETFYKSENLDFIVKHLMSLEDNDQFKQEFTASLYDKNSYLNFKFTDKEFLKHLTRYDTEELSDLVINHAYSNQGTFIALSKIKHHDMCETFANKFLKLKKKNFYQDNFESLLKNNNSKLNLK